MKNVFYILIGLLIVGCSSNNKTLEVKNCNFERKKQVAGMTELIYTCQEELDEQDCHKVEDDQCIYVIERRFPSWMNY